MNIVNHVDLPIERLPGKTPIKNKTDARIIYFYSNYRYWILDYAETLINGRGIKAFENTETVGDTYVPIFVNDAGYAFLALANGYFDMIGQLCGNDGDQYDCYRQSNKGKFQKFAINSNRNWKLWDNPPDNKDHTPETTRCVWYGLTVVLYEEYKKFISTNRKAKTSAGWARFCNSFYHQTRNPIAHTTFPNKLLITRDTLDLTRFGGG
ncbi:MAG: hypothetical protein K8L97_10575 [Anaerolineae bacterium]|nr:hypothetical protein [Anaerolineae bacterium]